jgi:hypothetical protein
MAEYIILYLETKSSENHGTVENLMSLVLLKGAFWLSGTDFSVVRYEGMKLNLSSFFTQENWRGRFTNT